MSKLVAASAIRGANKIVKEAEEFLNVYRKVLKDLSEFGLKIRSLRLIMGR